MGPLATVKKSLGSGAIKLDHSGSSTPEASTPASLQSTPSGIRSPAGSDADLLGSPSPLRHTLQLAADRLVELRNGEQDDAGAATSSAGGQARALGSTLAAAAVALASQPPPVPAAQAAPRVAEDLLQLADQAQLVQADADSLRDSLRGARRQLGALQQQLLAMHRQAARQQQLLGAVLLEKECECKLARSEAEAYRTASKARTAAVSSLNSAVVALQQDRGRLEAQVRQLSAALTEAGSRESALAAHDKQRSKDAETLAALAEQLRHKAAAAEAAHASAQAAVGVARQLGATVDGLHHQLQAARQREGELAADKQRLEQQVAADGVAAAELRAQVVQLQASVAQYAESHAALKRQLEAASAEAAQLAASMRAELDEQLGANAELREANEALMARAQAAEVEAGTAAGQMVSACEENAQLAEQLAVLQQQLEQLADGKEEHARVLRQLDQLRADKAGLEGQLAQAEADGASLRRMVRVLRRDDSAGPSPAAAVGAAVGGDASSVIRPRTSAAAAAARRMQQHEQLRNGSDIGSCDEVEEEEVLGAAPAAGGYGSCDNSPQRGGEGIDRQAQFLEEQITSLTAALRRLQRQNRELSAQLAAVQQGCGGAAAAGALVPAGGQELQALGSPSADAAALRLEVSGLVAENAALRRQVEEAAEEAGRAQWQMHRQQAEARALHSQVVEVMAILSEAGLAPSPRQPPSVSNPVLAATPAFTSRGGPVEPVAGASSAVRQWRQQQQQHQAVPAMPQSSGQAASVPATVAAAATEGSDVVSQLEQAIADLEVDDEPWQQEVQSAPPGGAPASATPASGAAFGSVSPAARGSSGRGAASLALRHVAADLAALNTRNAALQREIDGISLASSSGTLAASPARSVGAESGVALMASPARSVGQAAGGAKPAASSSVLLPRTPDIGLA